MHVMSGRPPNAERMWTHLVDGSDHVRVNKGSKPAIRDFLRRVHKHEWFAAIADTGQKHIVPWCPINAPGSSGRVLLEETLVALPDSDDGWRIVDVITEALTSGATKEEIGSGEYGSRAWSLLGHDKLRDLERGLSAHRGGGWFDLALWLSQRDEQLVAQRMHAEKVAKEAKHERRAKRESAKPDRGSHARASKRVPKDARVQRPEALGSVTGSPSVGGEAVGDSRGVADDDDKRTSTGSSTEGQLSMFS